MEEFLMKLGFMLFGAILSYLGSYFAMMASVKEQLKNQHDCIVAIDSDVEIIKKELPEKVKREEITHLYDKINQCQEKREADKFENRVDMNLNNINKSIQGLANKFDEFLINERKVSK